MENQFGQWSTFMVGKLHICVSLQDGRQQELWTIWIYLIHHC